MYGSLDVSVSGMMAQKVRLNAAAANLANQNSVLDADGNVNPYRRRMVFFAPGDPTSSSPQAREGGVQVAAIGLDPSPFNYKYEPGSPLAIKEGPKKGYVPYPNVNPVVEQVNAFAATRSYEANVTAAEATKSMFNQALRLIG